MTAWVMTLTANARPDRPIACCPVLDNDAAAAAVGTFLATCDTILIKLITQDVTVTFEPSEHLPLQEFLKKARAT